jgi:hypothetical protein
LYIKYSHYKPKWAEWAELAALFACSQLKRTDIDKISCTFYIMLVVGGWWLVVGGWWLVVGGWWLVVGGWWLVVGGWWLASFLIQRYRKTSAGSISNFPYNERKTYGIGVAYFPL